jgi:N-acetylglutamate synthase-like GNAT family acetyltransferase
MVREGAIGIRFARRADWPYLEREHSGLRRDRLARKVEAKEILVAERDDALVGFLDLDFLGAEAPYMSLIRVDGSMRRQGIGRALLKFAEEDLRRKGFHVLYSSSQGDEPEPQEWHRTVGFEPCGALEGFNENGVSEVFFRKRL